MSEYNEIKFKFAEKMTNFNTFFLLTLVNVAQKCK